MGGPKVSINPFIRFQAGKASRQIICSLIVVIAAPNALSYSRTAVAAGRSVGNAVRRNRAKRQLRVCIDSLHLSLRSGWDVIIYARKPITFANFSSIQKEVFMSFSDAGILLKDN